MLNKEQIKETIVNRLGIKNLDAYSEWKKKVFGKDTPILTQEDRELLSPDNIHNGAFWQVCEELFYVDPVSNCQCNKLPNDIDLGNKRNMVLARTTGMLNIVDEWKHYTMPILEIGAGYGNFKNYVELTTNMTYTGVDVYPKTNGVIASTPEGFLPESVLNMKQYGLIYSSNVFQHLSSKQRSRYFSDVSKILHPHGVFVFNLIVHFDDPKNPQYPVSDDNRRYLGHYGQFTEIPYYYELTAELKNLFVVLSEHRKFDENLFTFTCGRKDEPKVETPKEPVQTC